MLCFMTARLKAGSFGDFRRAWEPDEWPDQFLRAYHVRDLSDENSVVSFGLFEGSADDYRRLRDDPSAAAVEEKRQRGRFRPGEPDLRSEQQALGAAVAGVELTSGAAIRTRTAVVATGVHYRRLEAEDVERLIGAGVFYGASPSEAPLDRDGEVVVVGGANSAGQAALHLAEFARRVTMVVRGDSLAKAMSHYLVERIEAHARIEVRTQSRVTAARGGDRLETIVVTDDASQEEVELPADALFILIGGQPLTAGVEGWLRRDERGFLMTGPDVLDDGRRGRWWPLERDPMFLESSEPGIFVAGDVRHGSIKRVASAVGEGAMAIALIHRFLAAPDEEGRST